MFPRVQWTIFLCSWSQVTPYLLYLQYWKPTHHWGFHGNFDNLLYNRNQVCMQYLCQLSQYFFGFHHLGTRLCPLPRLGDPRGVHTGTGDTVWQHIYNLHNIHGFQGPQHSLDGLPKTVNNEYHPCCLVCHRLPLKKWGRVTHIFVSKLTIIWTNDGILLIRTFRTHFSEIVSEIHTFSFKKMHLKMSGKRRPSCLGLNVLKNQVQQINGWRRALWTNYFNVFFELAQNYHDKKYHYRKKSYVGHILFSIKNKNTSHLNLTDEDPSWGCSCLVCQ